jgi:hypothetical protein
MAKSSFEGVPGGLAAGVAVDQLAFLVASLVPALARGGAFA